MKLWHPHTEQPGATEPDTAVYVVALPGIPDFLDDANRPMLLPSIYTWTPVGGFEDALDGAPLCAAAYHWAREADLVAELIALEQQP